MLKKYKNQFLKIIIDHEFDPNDFIEQEGIADHNPAFIIKYKDTRLTFVARNSKENHHEFDWKFVEFAPDFPQTGYLPEDGWVGSEIIFRAFENWLEEHIREYLDELETPDMWEQVEKSKTIIQDLSGGKEDKGLFSIEEKEEVRKALNSFKEQAREELELSDAQASFLNDKIDYLAGAADRLTKFDWKNVAVSIIISSSIALSLDVEKGRILFNLFKEAFKITLKLISS